MSYSIKQAKDERHIDIAKAKEERDSEALYHLAEFEKEEGNDELAEALLAETKRIDREDWAYDEARDNTLCK